MTPVVFSPEALADLGTAVLYLREQRPRAGQRLLDEINAVITLLADGVVEGPEVALSSGEIVRRWVLPPYVIYYERRPEALWIARIYHGRRAPLEES